MLKWETSNFKTSNEPKIPVGKTTLSNYIKDYAISGILNGNITGNSLRIFITKLDNDDSVIRKELMD